MIPSLDILYEDNHCIAVVKPAGVPSTHFEGREETLDRAVKAYLKDKYGKPGNVFLGVVHRLDKPTSGVLLFARTSKAAARIARQFRDGAVEKIYWAVVEGDVKRQAGSLEDWLRKNEDTGRVEVVSPDAEGARQALLALPPPRRPRRPDVVGGAAADRAHAPAPRAARPPRPSHLRRREIRRDPYLRRRDRPARPRVDVSAPRPLRADHTDGRAAAAVARPIRLPLS